MIGIAGKNEKMKLAFENIVRENNCMENVKVLEFTNKVPELMSISDLVVTKPGGMTTTESLASELPMIIINPIPGQEVENAEFLESKNIAIWLRKDDNVNEVLTKLFESPTKLKEMKQNTKLLANINSTRDICDILLNQKHLTSNNGANSFICEFEHLHDYSKINFKALEKKQEIISLMIMLKSY